MFDLGIVNGNIYLEGKWIEGNLYIHNQKIAAISQSFLPCKEEYDAKERIVMPGLIDAHVHFALTVGKYTSKDDFYTGSKAAAYGGITTYIDFLDPARNIQEIEKAFALRRALAKDSVVDYGFHSTIAQPEEEPAKMLKAMKHFGIPTVKLFTTYSSSQRRTYDDYIDRLLQVSKALSTRVLVHAENEELLQEGVHLRVKDHAKARPALSEISEVLKLAEITRYREGLLYIVHTNCGTTVERVKELYPELLHSSLILESCPHYFTMTSSLYETEKGYLYTMTPPLRSEEERRKLCENIDGIDVIATDHCPFTKKEKQRDFVAQIPMGIGGISYSFFSMYKLFGEKIIDKFTLQPAKIHGLYPQKGSLMPGADADVIVFDPHITWTASREEEAAYTGIGMQGKVCCTLSRGNFVVKDGVFLGAQGQYVRREINVR